ncbi:MAG: hypothetical protein M1375_02010 [Candidatus Thermoplasmatota archaeon]|jgi:hypothetical protein|nr:hypothetical protein [Candidatus Thermoplasmatota archaeon]MCL5790732.1 hypothetical protein [Candidatus Thermoplasmatota archaeon]
MSKLRDVVINIVHGDPLYAILVGSGLVNYTSLAREIQDSVQNATGKQVKINTIVKVLTEEKIDTDSWSRQMNILSKADLSLEYRYEEKEVERIGPDCMDFAFAYRDRGRIKIITHSGEGGHLACIKVTLPEEGSEVPGLTFFIVRFLSIHGAKIERIYRLDREILLICNQNVADSIMTILSDLIIKSHS